jgi:hypothetical protein
MIFENPDIGSAQDRISSGIGLTRSCVTTCVSPVI